MANRAIISIAPRGHTFAELGELARRIDAGERLPEADYRLSFASAAQLFSELTQARLAASAAAEAIAVYEHQFADIKSTQRVHGWMLSFLVGLSLLNLGVLLNLALR